MYLIIKSLQIIRSISILGIFISLILGIINWFESPVKADIFATLIIVFCITGLFTSECIDRNCS